MAPASLPTGTRLKLESRKKRNGLEALGKKKDDLIRDALDDSKFRTKTLVETSGLKSEVKQAKRKWAPSDTGKRFWEINGYQRRWGGGFSFHHGYLRIRQLATLKRVKKSRHELKCNRYPSGEKVHLQLP